MIFRCHYKNIIISLNIFEYISVVIQRVSFIFTTQKDRIIVIYKLRHSITQDIISNYTIIINLIQKFNRKEYYSWNTKVGINRF